jgi:regulator of replication initiation timing
VDNNHAFNDTTTTSDLLYVTQIHELKRTVKQLAGERESLVAEVERLRQAYSAVVSQAMELEVVVRQKETEAGYREKVRREQEEAMLKMRRR